jgi:hypothetical protein
VRVLLLFSFRFRFEFVSFRFVSFCFVSFLVSLVMQCAHNSHVLAPTPLSLLFSFLRRADCAAKLDVAVSAQSIAAKTVLEFATWCVGDFGEGEAGHVKIETEIQQLKDCFLDVTEVKVPLLLRAFDDAARAKLRVARKGLSAADGAAVRNGVAVCFASTYTKCINDHNAGIEADLKSTRDALDEKAAAAAKVLADAEAKSKAASASR